MPAPLIRATPKQQRGKVLSLKFRFGGGIGAFEYDPKNPTVNAIFKNCDDRFGYLMPGPSIALDMTGIAANFRVVWQCKHNDVNFVATTDGTDSKIYREESSLWALKETVAAAVATWIGSFHDGTDSIVAVGYGKDDAFRFSVNDGTSWTASTLTGTKKNITYAYVQQDGLVPRVVYCVDPDEVYFANSLDNSATVSTAENVGSGNTADDYFTSIIPDDQGNLMIGKRHVLYRRMVLSDDSVVYQVVSPYYDDNQGDAGGQSDRRNFENPVNLDGRLFYPVNGYTLGMWYQGQWRSGLEPREAGPRIPRLDLPINALARAGRWLVLAIGSKNTATLKTITSNAPGGTALLQNTFATVSDIYLGQIVGGPSGESIRWHGLILQTASPLRYMWFDEDDSYLYMASGDAESADLSQRRALVYTDDPLYRYSGAVLLNTGVVTAETPRVRLGGRWLLRHASARTVGLYDEVGTNDDVTLALGYRNEPGRDVTSAFKTLTTWKTDAKSARGQSFPTSRTFEEVWFQFVLDGNTSPGLVGMVEEVELLVESLG